MNSIGFPRLTARASKVPPARRVPRHRPVAADTLTEPAIATEANRIEAGYRKRQEPERRGHCRDLETPGDQKKKGNPVATKPRNVINQTSQSLP